MTRARGPRKTTREERLPITVLLRSPTAFQRVARELRALEAELEPMHPGIHEEPLCRYGQVLAPAESLPCVLQWLLAHPLVEAAFTKPADAPP